MKLENVYLVVLVFIFIVVIGGIILVESRQPKLKTSLSEWKECRSDAWINCNGQDYGDNLNSLMNDLCDGEYPNFIGDDNCDLLSDIQRNCWEAQAQLCDQQFDMEKIYG